MPHALQPGSQGLLIAMQLRVPLQCQAALSFGAKEHMCLLFHCLGIGNACDASLHTCVFEKQVVPLVAMLRICCQCRATQFSSQLASLFHC